MNIWNIFLITAPLQPTFKTYLDTRLESGPHWDNDKDFLIQNLNNSDSSTIFTYNGNHPFDDIPPNTQVQVGVGAKPNKTYGASEAGSHHAVLDIFGNTHLRSGVIDWYGRKTAPSLGTNEIPVLTAYPDADGTIVQWTGISNGNACGLGGANNVSFNFAGGGATGTEGLSESKYFGGAKVTDGGIYNDTSGTNLIYQTFFVTGRSYSDTESPGQNPTYNAGADPSPVVCDDQIYTSASWSFGLENACYKVIDPCIA